MINNFFFAIIIVLTSFVELSAQNIADKYIPVIPLDRSVLSGVGLEKVNLKETPEKEFFQKRLFWGKDLGIFVVGTQTWNTKFEHYPFDEFIYMYNGEAIVRPILGESQVFYAGDFFFANKGFAGNWEVKGNDLNHYELSVITTTRADSLEKKIETKHRLFSKAQLSGNSISLNDYGLFEKTLEEGVELTVQLKAEKPNAVILPAQRKDQLIHLLAGQVTIKDTKQKETTFYTGDFFILPKGFSGQWKSEGHHLVKYLSVSKSY